MARPRLAALVPALLALLVGAGGCGESDDRLRADPRRAVPDAEVAELLEALGGGDAAAVDAACARIEEAGDLRFVAPLIELLPASQMGIAGRRGYERRVVTLERLTGLSLGADWFAWAEWYGGTALEPPPGFAAWKGALLSALDPGFGPLLAGDPPTRIRVEEIHWGGVPLEGIPALDAPRLISAAEGSAQGLSAEDPVVGIVLAGDARAYPLRILDWHELVNDEVGGVPIALAYCTLCGSAVAYDARAGGGDALRFGTSGLLYRSNKLMIDRETRTLWNQLTGRPVLGPLAAREDLALEPLPAVVAAWSDWRARHPETRVLSGDTGHERPYRPGEPYGGYFASAQKLFPVHESRRELPSKERVFGLALDGTTLAFSLEDLVDAKVLNAEVGRVAVVLVATEGRLDVEGRSAVGGFVHYDAGGAVRAYRRNGQRFRLGPDDVTLVDQADRPWQLEEEALLGPDGARAPRLPGTLAYWFAWQSFHPRTELWNGRDAAHRVRTEE